MKKEIKITHEEWFKAMLGTKERPENAFTFSELIKITGKKRSTLYVELDKLIKAGKLRTDKYLVNGHIQNCYTKIDDKESH